MLLYKYKNSITYEIFEKNRLGKLYNDEGLKVL